MITYTDTQLKEALAKMLPDKIMFDELCEDLCWMGKMSISKVLDTELLHLCWLVEEELQYPNSVKYYDSLTSNHATWQQRVIALCKVKGITI